MRYLWRYVNFGICAIRECGVQLRRRGSPRYFFRSPVAGLSISPPASVNLEPWQGQSHVCSAGFHFSAQPRCGQRFVDGVSRLMTDSKAFAASCGRSTVLDGEKSSAYWFFLPVIISHKTDAATMEDVIPHLLNPVATYKLDVPEE